MRILYDKDSDYAEVLFKKTKNYVEEMSDLISVFKDERTDKVVGYQFENASKSALKTDLINSQVKLAILLRMVRADLGLTQEEAARRIGEISTRHYQRLESGDENTTLDVLERITHAFPSADITAILGGRKHSA